MKRSFRDVLKIHLEKKVDMRLAANIPDAGRRADRLLLRHGPDMPAAYPARDVFK
jgi:hypothetical protein